MKLNRLLLAACLLTCCLFSWREARASHAAGADLTYTCLGNNQYQISLAFYRDCDGIAAPASASVSILNGCTNTTTSITLQQKGFVEVTQLCPSQIGNSSCNGGNLPGIQQYTYIDTFTFPTSCTNFTLRYDLNARNAAVTNLQNPGSVDLYVEATLRGITPNVCNSSSIFTSLPVPFVCVGNQFFYNHGAIDVDGDSLVYTLIQPLQNPGTVVPWAAGFSVANPMATTSGFSFNNATGQMSGTPSVAQNAAIAVRVDEYRNGVLIGSTIRDMQFIAVACPNNTLPTASGVNGSTDYSINVCAGSNTCFDIFTSDVDAGQSTTITWNSGITGASFNASTGTNQIGTFCWTPGVNQARSAPYIFTVTVQDNACPSVGNQVYSYSVFVGGLDVDLGPDLSLCASSATLSPLVTNGTGVYTYAWSNGSTDSTLVVTQSGSYSVTITDGTGCSGSDQINVNINPNGNRNLIAFNDTTVCPGVAVTLDAGTGFSTYLWSTGATSQVITTSTPGVITVEATDSSGCTSRDTVTILNSNSATVSIGNDTALCSGGNYTFVPSPSNFASYLWSDGSTSPTLTVSATGVYSVTVTTAAGCAASDTARYTAFALPSVTLGPDVVTCNSPYILQLRRAGTFNYIWSTGSTLPSIAVTQTGWYSLTLTDFINGCGSYDSIYVTISNLPSTNLIPDTLVTLCGGLTPGTNGVALNAVPGLGSYLWSNGDTAANTTVSQDGLYTLTVTDSLGCTKTDSIRVVTSPSISITDVSASLCAPASGTIDLTVTGGLSPFTFSWSGPGGFTASSEDLAGLNIGTYEVVVTDAAGCTASHVVTIALPNITIDAGPDTVNICLGDSTTLSATGATFYTWNGGSLVNATGSSVSVSPTQTTTYTVVGQQPGQELVANGDFELGNTGFSTNYQYTTTNLVPEGTYAVVTNPTPLHPAFLGSDHTSGSTNFMAINGSINPGFRVWCQTVSVIPNTDYNFSTWISTLVVSSPAELEFSIDGQLLGTPITAPNALNTWTQFFATWNSGSATTVEICIVNANTTAGGNDFGLDDISFTPVCTGIDQVTVVVNTPPTVNLGADDSLCIGSSTLLDAGQGFGSYLWSDGSTGQTLLVSAAGTYSVTVTDANGCTNSDTIALAPKLCCFPANFGNIFTLIDATNSSISSDEIWNGKYYVTTDITVSNGATLDLTNVDVVFLPGTGITFTGGSQVRANNSVFRTCELDQYWDGFAFLDSSNGTFNESLVKNAEIGLSIQTSDKLNVTNSEFYNNATGIRFDGASSFDGGVTGNTFVSNEDRPEYLDAAGAVVTDFFGVKVFNSQLSGVISQNDFVNSVANGTVSNLYYGVYVNTSSVSVSSNKFTNMYRAFDLTGNGGSVTFENNTAEFTRRSYFDVYPIRITDVNSSPILVEGNIVTYSSLAQNNNNQVAIYVNNVRNLIISNNTLTGFATGVRLGGGSRNIDVLGNTISDADLFGVYVIGGQNYDIEENVISNIGASGIYLSNVRTQARVTANQIEIGAYNNTFGIRYVVTAGNVTSTSVVFADNCVRNSFTAIQVQSNVANTVPTIRNNYLYNYQGHGLWSVGFTGSVGTCANYPAGAGRNSFISNYLAPFGTALDVRSDNATLQMQGNSANLVTNFPNVLVNTSCNTTSNTACGNQIGNNEGGGRGAGLLTQMLMFQQMIEGTFPMTLNFDEYVLKGSYMTDIEAVTAENRMEYVLSMIDILSENGNTAEMDVLYAAINNSNVLTTNELAWVSYHYNVLVGNFNAAANALAAYQAQTPDQADLKSIETIRTQLLIDGRTGLQLTATEITILKGIDDNRLANAAIARDLVHAGISNHDYFFESLKVEPADNSIIDASDLTGDFVNVYPNPSNGDVTIEYNTTEASEDVTIRIVDVLGQVIYETPVTFTNGTLHLNMNNYANGAYFITVTGAKKVLANTKLIKF
jgi:hypothetical protein